MTDATTRITLIRHGHVHNPNDIVYGRLPGFGLSNVGRNQAEAVARHLSGAELAALYCSPQQRAEETAKILLHYHPELEIVTACAIDEIDNYFEGHPTSDVAARGWDLYTGVSDGYEMPEDVGSRAGKFLLRAREAHAAQHVAAVTHGDVIAFGVLWAMQRPLHVSLRRTLDRFGITDRYPATASLTTLIYRSDDPQEIPEIVYERPYGEERTVATLP
ncbi:MAG: histidine phosphatase family protein [Anaerolineae bacterium]|nr:histidine phosphatase family protein [Anaerolineae bacterium]